MKEKQNKLTSKLDYFDSLKLAIDTIKCQNQKDIEIFIDKTIVYLKKDDNLLRNLKSYLKQFDIEFKGNIIKFLRIIFLSLILSDVGTQGSPYNRSANIDKINQISSKWDINYKNVLNLTVYSEGIWEIIASNT